MRSRRSRKLSHTQTSVPCGTLNNGRFMCPQHMRSSAVCTTFKSLFLWVHFRTPNPFQGGGGGVGWGGGWEGLNPESNALEYRNYLLNILQNYKLHQYDALYPSTRHGIIYRNENSAILK